MTSLEATKQEVKIESADNELSGQANDAHCESKVKADQTSQDTCETSNDDNNNNGTHTEGDSRDDNNDEGTFEDDNNGDSNNQMVAYSDNDTDNDNDKTNLIVNYLPQQMTDEQFQNLFEKFGKMKSCKIVRNRMTGYSYGFGFVDFESHEQAIKAIEELNGQEVDTKKIKVAFARPAGQDIKQANLYVKNVPTSWSQDDVRKVFEPYGQIIQVRVLGNDRGVAFVLFDLRKQAQDALEALNGKQVDGCDAPFEIKFAAEKKGEKRGNRGGANRNRMNQRGSGGGGGGDRNNQRSGSLSGPRTNQGNNNNNNNNNNNRNNRGTSDNRRSTSQGRAGNMYRNNNDQYGPSGGGGPMNGGVGPMRQQQNRMNRYAPFAPVQQAPTMAPQPAPMAQYGYAQQPMLPYMMPNQMMQMPMGQPMMNMGGGPPVNPYAMGATMRPISYAQPPMSQPSVAMNNMYNVASNTMNNAAQMQPQLGQPMNMRSTVGGGGGGGGGLGSVSGGSGGGGSGGGGNQQTDGVTLFVYNIGPDCDESELRDMFASFGAIVRCNVVRKAPGGETKGFGFVTLKTREQASAAIAALNNSMRNGRSLQVSFKK